MSCLEAIREGDLSVLDLALTEVSLGDYTLSDLRGALAYRFEQEEARLWTAIEKDERGGAERYFAAFADGTLMNDPLYAERDKNRTRLSHLREGREIDIDGHIVPKLNMGLELVSNGHLASLPMALQEVRRDEYPIEDLRRAVTRGIKRNLKGYSSKAFASVRAGLENNLTDLDEGYETIVYNCFVIPGKLKEEAA